MRRAVLLLLCLSSPPAFAAAKVKAVSIPGRLGTRQVFAGSERDVRLAVDRVFTEFAALGWAVREENDSVHGAYQHGTAKTALHAYLTSAGAGKIAVRLVYDARRMTPAQRGRFEADILKNVAKQLKAAARASP